MAENLDFQPFLFLNFFITLTNFRQYCQYFIIVLYVSECKPDTSAEQRND